MSEAERGRVDPLVGRVRRCPKCQGTAGIARHGILVCVKCLSDQEVRIMEWDDNSLVKCEDCGKLKPGSEMMTGQPYCRSCY